MSRDGNTSKGFDLPPPYENTSEGSDYHNIARTSATSQDTNDITCSFRGYEGGKRKTLTLPTSNAKSFSYWNILKSTLTQSLSAPSLPISFNEPLSQLQRQAEDLEYAYLLSTAVDAKDSVKRMLYVATFAISKYASVSEIFTRPFNPLLGETFEYVDPNPEKGYRFVAEQIRHHPPCLAVSAEGLRWRYYGESAMKYEVRVRGIEVKCIGTWFLTLRLGDGTEEVYSWGKPSMFVRMPVLSGRPVIEEYGGVRVRNWGTGEVCIVDGFKVGSGSEIHGKFIDADGKTGGELKGIWNENIRGTILVEKTKDDNVQFKIWDSNRRGAKKEDYLAPFLIGLNDDPMELKAFLPPTDSRFRPDQRLLEKGYHESADVEKKRIEELQRKRQSRREEDGLKYTPSWFTRQTCKVTGEEYWHSDGEYWSERVKNDTERWKGVVDIFDRGNLL